MYYEAIQQFRNPKFICVNRQTSLSDLDGDMCAVVTGTHGILVNPNPFDLQDIQDWSLNVGYFLSTDIPPRNFNEFDTSLALYPDNEEMVLLYNHSDQSINVSLINTLKLPSDMVQWTSWNFYDDLWGTVYNDHFDVHQVKDIRNAVNFDPNNSNKYQPLRLNHQHQLKLFPRHPMLTPCMFAPRNHMKEIRIMTDKLVDQHGEIIEGVLSHPYDQRYQIEHMIQPKSFCLLDQLITQWKINQGSSDDFTMIPLWYKTHLRKHFNYSV